MWDEEIIKALKYWQRDVGELMRGGWVATTAWCNS
jgi:hypothetical protein